MTRREFVRDVGLLSAGMAVFGATGRALSAETPQRKMTMDLVCGAIGVSANQRKRLNWQPATALNR
jgi:hypothetical protein